MSGPSNIEWTGHTWNPVAGCSVLTPGCTNCYAMKMAARLEAMGQALYAGLTKQTKAGAVWTGTVRLAPEHVLLAPLKRKKPTTYFVNSMSDLFHEDVPDEWVDRIFAVMALCPQHTFQVLTKRSNRMRVYCADKARPAAVWRAIMKIDDSGIRLPRLDGSATLAALHSHGAAWGGDQPWPLANVWLGVSTERQIEADERIPHLLVTPAAVRFISAEPLLGSLDISNYLVELARTNWEFYLDWVIVGGESGHDARPMQVEWADQIVAQCGESDVACFVKQLGAMPTSDGYPLELKSKNGGDPAEWPDRLNVRELPKAAA